MWRPGTRIGCRCGCESPPNAKFCLPPHLAPDSPAPQRRGRWAPWKPPVHGQGPGAWRLLLCPGRGAAFLEPRQTMWARATTSKQERLHTVIYVLQFNVTAFPLSFHGDILQMLLPCQEGELAVLRDVGPASSGARLPLAVPGQGGCGGLCGAAGRASEEGSPEAGGDRSGPRKKACGFRYGESHRTGCSTWESAAQKQPPCAHCPRAEP